MLKNGRLKTVRLTVFCHRYSQSLCAWKVQFILFYSWLHALMSVIHLDLLLVSLFCASHDCHWDTMLINLLALGFHIYEVLCWHFMLSSVVIYWRFLSGWILCYFYESFIVISAFYASARCKVNKEIEEESCVCSPQNISFFFSNCIVCFLLVSISSMYSRRIGSMKFIIHFCA